MKQRASLLAAAVVVLAANAFALLHAWRNRSGPVESDIMLTERELYVYYTASDEDSGVTLNLHWSDPRWPMYGWERPATWLNQQKLNELGFDTSIAPSDKTAFEFYQRQRPRRAFAALEFNGPGWFKWLENQERQAQQQAAITHVKPESLRETSTRLVAIDAGSDAARLRGRHPYRGSVVIVPAVIRIGVELRGDNQAALLYGSIQEIPSTIHVPLPFSEAFRRQAGNRNRSYRVHLLYGALHEPWVERVEFFGPTAR